MTKEWSVSSTRTRRAWLAAAAVGASLAAGGGQDARAATVALEEDRVVVRAAPGETNRVTVGARDEQGRVVSSSGAFVAVLDAGAPLTAGAGCARDDTGVVQCPDATGSTEVEVDLGDGDDSASPEDYFVAHRQITLRGGDGNDRLTVGSGAGARNGTPVLEGGPGDDVLGTSLNYGGGAQQDGGPGDDRLWANEVGFGRLAGGDGHDVIGYGGFVLESNAGVALTGGRGDDVFDLASEPFEPRVVAGGDGFDTLRAGGLDPVVVDLAACPLCRLERVVGTPWDDVLLGDHRRVQFEGRAGDDVIDPRGGRDSADGGPGADRITTSDGEADTARCGPGADVLVADALDRIARDCEPASTPAAEH